MLYGVFENDICVSILGDGDIALPKSATSSDWPRRYRLVDGKAVDAFKGLSDEDAITKSMADDATKEKERAIAISKQKDKSNAMTRLAFMQRFTPEERVALRGLETTDPLVGDLFEMIRLAEGVDLTDELTIQGIEYLVNMGQLTQDRANEILAI